MTEFTGRLGHLEDVESPWANAGGVAKTIEDVEALAQTGVGWIEDGSQTILPRIGNGCDKDHPELGLQFTVYTHDPKTGKTGNSLGMPNRGIDVWQKEIPQKVAVAEAHRKKFIQNVAPISDNPAEETLELVERSYESGAHAVLVNASCPNVVTEYGGRHKILSKSHDALGSVLNGLKSVVEKHSPVFLRISPTDTSEEMQKTCQIIRASGVVSALFVPNTWPGYEPLDENDQQILQVPGGKGGLSGPAVAKRAALQTSWACHFLRGSKVDVVSSSGIMNGRELQHRLAIGAVAGCGTTFYYESKNGWQVDTNRLLNDYVDFTSGSS